MIKLEELEKNIKKISSRLDINFNIKSNIMKLDIFVCGKTHQ